MNTLPLDRPRPVGATRNGWIEEDKDKAGNGAQVQAAAQDIWMLSLGSDLPPGKVARIPLLLFAPPLSLDLDQARDEDDCANMSQTILSYIAHLCSLDVAI